MKKDERNTNIELTSNVYLCVSKKIIGEIAQTRQDIEDVISRIRGRIDYLKELRADIAKRDEEIKKLKQQKKFIRLQIRNEKKLLHSDKIKKFSLTRELITKKNNSAKLNRLYINGEETIDINEFYPLKEQKTR